MTEVRSYYGRPVIKEPVWKPEIPFYLFAGGLAGASAALAYGAELAGAETLARRTWPIALGAVTASPALLVSDLGVPSRFLNMLRLFKVTSPMSVGSWILSGAGASTALATANVVTGLFPRAGRLAKPAAALLGLPLSTYTAALIAQTAVPVWHDARRDLPFVFAAGAALSAGAAATIATPVRDAAPARRLATLAAAAETFAVLGMEQRLGDVGHVYSEGAAGKLKRAAHALTVGGALGIAGWGRSSRVVASAGAAAALAGAVAMRWSVFKAGFQSAAEPADTIRPQRARR